MVSKANQVDEPLWTVDEAARFLRLSKKYIYRLVESGRLPHYKLGRRVRFSGGEVRSYLKTCRSQRA